MKPLLRFAPVSVLVVALAAPFSLLTGQDNRPSIVAATANPDLALPKTNYPSESSPATRTIVYRKVDGKELLLHAWEPSGGSTLRPAVLFFHGGGFTGGDPSSYRGQCDTLSQLGIVAISAQYRLLDRDSRPRDPRICVDDAQAAFRHVVRHAEDLGIDRTRIAVGGGSAGGYLSLAITLLPHREAPHWEIRPGLLLLYNPYAGMRDGETGLLTSVEGVLPPALVMHGDNDTTVPLASSESLAARWRAEGGELALSVYDGQKHAFFNYGVSANNYDRTLREIVGFLATHGWMR